MHSPTATVVPFLLPALLFPGFGLASSSSPTSNQLDAAITSGPSSESSLSPDSTRTARADTNTTVYGHHTANLTANSTSDSRSLTPLSTTHSIYTHSVANLTTTSSAATEASLLPNSTRSSLLQLPKLNTTASASGASSFPFPTNPSAAQPLRNFSASAGWNSSASFLNVSAPAGCPQAASTYGFTNFGLPTIGSGASYASACSSQSDLWSSASQSWSNGIASTSQEVAATFPITMATGGPLFDVLCDDAFTRASGTPTTTATTYTTITPPPKYLPQTLSECGHVDFPVPLPSCSLLGGHGGAPNGTATSSSSQPAGTLPIKPVVDGPLAEVGAGVGHGGFAVAVGLPVSNHTGCEIFGRNVKLYYWPVDVQPGTWCPEEVKTITSAPTSTRTAVVDGTTITSPTVYMSIDRLDFLGDSPYESLFDIRLTMPASSVSSLVSYVPGKAWQDVLSTVIQTGWAVNLDIQSSAEQYNFANLDGPVSARDYFMAQTDLRSLYQQPYRHNTIFEDYHPVLSAPQQLLYAYPKLSSCSLALQGIYDPPSALVPASSFAVPTLTSGGAPTPFNAVPTPASSPAPPPSQTPFSGPAPALPTQTSFSTPKVDAVSAPKTQSPEQSPSAAPQDPPQDTQTSTPAVVHVSTTGDIQSSQSQPQPQSFSFDPIATPPVPKPQGSNAAQPVSNGAVNAATQPVPPVTGTSAPQPAPAVAGNIAPQPKPASAQTAAPEPVPTSQNPPAGASAVNSPQLDNSGQLKADPVVVSSPSSPPTGAAATSATALPSTSPTSVHALVINGETILPGSSGVIIASKSADPQAAPQVPQAQTGTTNTYTSSGAGPSMTAAKPSALTSAVIIGGQTLLPGAPAIAIGPESNTVSLNTANNIVVDGSQTISVASVPSEAAASSFNGHTSPVQAITIGGTALPVQPSNVLASGVGAESGTSLPFSFAPSGFAPTAAVGKASLAANAGAAGAGVPEASNVAGVSQSSQAGATGLATYSIYYNPDGSIVVDGSTTLAATQTSMVGLTMSGAGWTAQVTDIPVPTGSSQGSGLQGPPGGSLSGSGASLNSTSAGNSTTALYTGLASSVRRNGINVLSTVLMSLGLWWNL